MLLLASRARASRPFLLTIATWIKVWPAALIAAVLICEQGAHQGLRHPVIVTSAIIVGVALALGSGIRVFSFVTQQTSTGAPGGVPVSSIWMWMSYAHVAGAFPYYDQAINTFEVDGSRCFDRRGAC